MPSWRSLRPYLISAVALVIAGAALLYLSHTHYVNKLEELAIDAGRDYHLAPFDIIDATRYCQIKTERKFGENLALSYVDDHSSRQDPRSGIFKIFMVAHLGDLNQYDEEAVHCFIDPHRRVMTHYRTISLQQDSLMNRAIKFFQ